MLWAAVAKFCSISRMKVSTAFSRGDETSQSQQEKFPVTDVFNYVEVADGRVWMRPEGVARFAGGAGCRPLQPECPWHGLEVEAELVHRGQPRPPTVHPDLECGGPGQSDASHC
jgi:hypothetical protein